MSKKPPRWDELPYFSMPEDWMHENLDPSNPDHFHRCPPDGKTFRNCLLWQGSCNADGYAIKWVPLRIIPASVIDHSLYAPGARILVRVIILMWEQHNHRKVEPGFVIHHACHVEDGCKVRPAKDCIHRKCSEYSHLAERTRKQNRGYVVPPEQEPKQPQQPEKVLTPAGIRAQRLLQDMYDAGKRMPGKSRVPPSIKRAVEVEAFGLVQQEKWNDEMKGRKYSGVPSKEEKPILGVMRAYDRARQEAWAKTAGPYDIRHFPERDGDREFVQCGWGGWCWRNTVRLFTPELGWVTFDERTFLPHSHVFGIGEQVQDMMKADPVLAVRWWHWALDGAISSVEVTFGSAPVAPKQLPLVKVEKARDVEILPPASQPIIDVEVQKKHWWQRR